MSNEETEKEKGEGKVDIKMLVSIIPSPKELKMRKKVQLEKRIRVRRIDEVKEGKAYINPKLAKELNIKDYLEVVVAGRKKLVLEAVLDERVPEREVWCNTGLLKEHGVADNSIATVRAKR